MKEFFKKAAESAKRGAKKVIDKLKYNSPDILSLFVAGLIASVGGCAAGVLLSIPGAILAGVGITVLAICTDIAIKSAVKWLCTKKGIETAQKTSWEAGIPSLALGCIVANLTICPLIYGSVEKTFNEKSAPAKPKSANERTYNVQNSSPVFQSQKLLQL